MLRQRGKQAHWGNTWDNARGAGAVNWVGRVQRHSWPFLVSQMSLVFQNKTSLLDNARISNNSYVRALVSRASFVFLNYSTMKKKESGAEGRKRREIDAEESERASKFMKTFFVRPRESNSPDFKKSPDATSLLGSENDTQSKEEIISEAEQQG
ncbi:hypothetical protein AVEN_110195-1 [Araneus ventricosus]|uniref:Uncharacterized protein n=1 Tax=Araneus ventricosus TaxID=182803 RepID=A0A4Y2FDG3_ARAVE|nr:hypothetical protein AVEN_110195-1 [Araneus ventricosus]